MSFLEVETWTIKDGVQQDHDQMIRNWFRYVKEHHADMFQEWKSARYYRQVTREGMATGRYVMLFEFYTREGFQAYKERRKDWSGPYADYKKIDPYQFFDLATVTEDYWKPEESELWFEFNE